MMLSFSLLPSLSSSALNIGQVVDMHQGTGGTFGCLLAHGSSRPFEKQVQQKGQAKADESVHDCTGHLFENDFEKARYVTHTHTFGQMFSSSSSRKEKKSSTYELYVAPLARVTQIEVPKVDRSQVKKRRAQKQLTERPQSRPGESDFQRTNRQDGEHASGQKRAPQETDRESVEEQNDR